MFLLFPFLCLDKRIETSNSQNDAQNVYPPFGAHPVQGAPQHLTSTSQQAQWHPQEHIPGRWQAPASIEPPPPSMLMPPPSQWSGGPQFQASQTHPALSLNLTPYVSASAASQPGVFGVPIAQPGVSTTRRSNKRGHARSGGPHAMDGSRNRKLTLKIMLIILPTDVSSKF